jgi:hypothetical protein
MNSGSAFSGPRGLERLEALMHSACAARVTRRGTQEYVLGWLYGLADAGALDENTLSTAQRRLVAILDKPWKTVKFVPAVELYDYPNEATCRVEGLSTAELDGAIMAGGPFYESRVTRIYQLAQNPEHERHFLAKHYLFLSRAKLASP